jgi:hypothetical protein
MFIWCCRRQATTPFRDLSKASGVAVLVPCRGGLNRLPASSPHCDWWAMRGWAASRFNGAERCGYDPSSRIAQERCGLLACYRHRQMACTGSQRHERSSAWCITARQSASASMPAILVFSGRSSVSRDRGIATPAARPRPVSDRRTLIFCVKRDFEQSALDCSSLKTSLAANQYHEVVRGVGH